MRSTITRRRFLAASSIASLTLMQCATKRRSEPNIIFFLSDDQNKTDVGCYGNPVIRTPNIDRLAKEGMKFNRAFTPTAMCAPSRSSLYTGLYPHRHGCHMNHGSVKAGIQSLPHYMSDLGYRTALAGKKHIKPKEAFPFEYLDHDIPTIQDFITRDSSPFCLVVASNEPHGPHETGGYDPGSVQLTADVVDTRETRRQWADYYTDIDLVDQEVGEVLDLLDQTRSAGNTLFFFAGDHGYDIFAKWSCYERGLHVPFIVRWPGRVKAGSESDALISFVDVVPTLIEAANCSPPKDIDGRSFLSVLLGKTHKHHDKIFGAQTTRGIWSGVSYPIRSVRTERYKYIRNLDPNSRFQCIPTHGWDYDETHGSSYWKSWQRKAESDAFAASRVKKLIRRPAEELYDLEYDPYELNNLADSQEHKEILDSLRTALDDWMRQQGDRGIEAEMAVPLKPARTVERN